MHPTRFGTELFRKPLSNEADRAGLVRLYENAFALEASNETLAGGGAGWGDSEMTILAEAGAFTVVSVGMGWFGARPLAAHNVALSLGTTTFQVALAIGAATSVRVGHAIGRDDPSAMRRAGFLGMGAGAAFMLTAGATFCVIPALLARLITDNELVIESAIPFIMVCGAFQLVDGLQTVAAGALRGLGDTRTAFVVNVCGHYLLGLPVAGALIWGFGAGPVALWWGLFAGLATVSVVLVLRFHTISRRPIQRLDPDAT